MFIHLPTRPMYMFSKTGWVEREGEGRKEKEKKHRRGGRKKGREGGRDRRRREEGYLTDQSS